MVLNGNHVRNSAHSGSKKLRHVPGGHIVFSPVTSAMTSGRFRSQLETLIAS